MPILAAMLAVAASTTVPNAANCHSNIDPIMIKKRSDLSNNDTKEHLTPSELQWFKEPIERQQREDKWVSDLMDSEDGIARQHHYQSDKKVVEGAQVIAADARP